MILGCYSKVCDLVWWVEILYIWVGWESLLVIKVFLIVMKINIFFVKFF